MRAVAGSLAASALVGVLAAIPAAATATPGPRLTPGATGPLGVVATESHAASRAGRAVLEDGGNAVDAAVASVFALGAARPQSCGIGGGGFLMYRSRTGAVRSLDFRETAPAAMTPTTLAGPGLHKTFTGHLTVGVPGTVAGMDAALQRYGTRTLAEAIAPAERLAREGFRVPSSLSASMKANADRLRLFPAARDAYLAGGAAPYAAGSTLRQPDLAASLRRIQRGGPAAFYRGTIARRVLRDMQAPRPTGEPGLLTAADLAGYRPRWREPILASYRGHEVLLPPPPTSGGVAIAEMLNVLSGFDLRALGRSSAASLHLLAEAQKLAFADRNALVADPDAVAVPTATLTSRAYGAARAREIDPARAKTYAPGLGARARRADAAENAKGSTTNVSVLDRRGNAVVITCTIEQEFGSAVVAPGTGFLLNNELTDFGAPGTANQPAPRKRPRSSIAPAIVVDPRRRPVLAVGGAGGARIIEGVLLAIVDVVDFGAGVPEAVDAERLDAPGPGLGLTVEDGRLGAGVLADLEARGHRIAREGLYGARPRITAAGVVPGAPRGRSRVAIADPRTDQAALAQRERRP